MAISWIFLISAHVPQRFKMHHVCVHAWSRLPQLRSLYVRQRDMLGTCQGALVWKPSNRSTSFIWKTRIGDAVIFEERGNDTIKDRRSQGHLGCWKKACSLFKQLGTFLCVICAQLLPSEFTRKGQGMVHTLSCQDGAPKNHSGEGRYPKNTGPCHA